MATATKTSADSKLDKNRHPQEVLQQAYQDMLLVRRFEEMAGRMYQQKLIQGFCHLYDGQEAVVIGMQSCLIEGDAVVTSYRDHGHMLACGMNPDNVMAELMGRRSGYSKGKGGSMHMFSHEKHFYGGHGIVGAQVPIGTGVAFALKYKETNNLCLTYFGDGASNQGQIYEAFNMASLWQLPVIYIIENNQYGMGTSVARASAMTELHRRGEGFGIPGRSVDGMDLINVREAGLEAVEHVRSGKGPILLEMKTYRFHGHSMTDPGKYRTKEEVQHFRDEDPIKKVMTMLTSEYGADENSLKDQDKAMRKRIQESVDFAKNDPEPDLSELYTDVLVES